jgi:SWI/SNF-related matrix-associated actin-dependent regulator 1 of chromatin subfamily A
MIGDAIGEALAAACDDRAVLARLGGELGAAALAAHDRLAREARPAARQALRAQWAAAARAPAPPGLRGVHPSWIEAALADLPPRARADLARGGAGGSLADAADPVAVWLVRWACAGLPPLPAADATGAPSSIEHAARLRGDDLAAWLAEVGADQLALALGAAGAAGAEAIAAAARVVGARLVRAAARIAAAPRSGALGPARAVIARCRIPLDDRALLVIGARAIAPHAGPLSRRQLAVRLPRPLGLAVADALAAFAYAPVEQSPSWRALSATF